MSHKAVPLSKIKPNPHRKMERYPVSQEKIEALMASMERTGFWDNVVAREQDGYAELAYGHHRWLAFERKFGKRAKMNLIIRRLSDADMLRIMADENADEYGTSAAVQQETIRAVVEAYAEGRIELPAVKNLQRGGGLRNAPTFRVVKSSGNPAKPYNAESIARFLGWLTPSGQVQEKVRDALRALELAEEMDADADVAEMSTGLGNEQVEHLRRAVSKVEREHRASGRTLKQARDVALRAGKAIAKKMKNSEIGYRQVDTEAGHFMPPKRKPPLPPIDDYVQAVAQQLGDTLRFGKLTFELEELLKYKTYIAPSWQTKLVKALESLRGRCDKFIDKFNASPVGTKAHLLLEHKK